MRLTFRRLVTAVQLAAIAATVVTVAMLDTPPPAGSGPSSFGASVFAANCATCHGSDGIGLIGPDLTSGHVFERFDSRAAMMAFVTEGFGEMPPMGERISVGEIGAVTDFVRGQLAG
jgi:mono/diheme cytochrome c family protein